MQLSTASFEFVRTVLRQRCGHHLEDDKAYLVETRLLPLARRQRFDSVEAFLARLRGGTEEKLLVELVEAMAIGETSFFRDGQPFDVLRQIALPELIRRRERTRCLTIWSAACSSGQEPYSVALLLKQHFPELDGWQVRLIASDLSNGMLERARLGLYSDLEVSRGLTPEHLAAYFTRGADGWRIRDEIRRRVEFRWINLNDAWPLLPLLDLVLLRNVLIYFDIAAKARILSRAAEHMQPDGFLLLGGAETTYNLGDQFLPVPSAPVSIFQRKT